VELLPSRLHENEKSFCGLDIPRRRSHRVSLHVTGKRMKANPQEEPELASYVPNREAPR